MIVDCFTFYNELKMLLFRLEYLYETVDYFVIVEALVTHAGNAKPLFFKENEAMFEKYKNKIVHVVVEDMPTDDWTWSREIFQRNCIDRGIKTLTLNPNDIICISDCDEIPNRNVISKVNGNLSLGVYSLNQRLYYYNFSGLFKELVWSHSKILNYSTYLSIGCCPNDIRLKIKPVGEFDNAGWHFSYFGSPEFISNKIKNFAHNELNIPIFTDVNQIKKRIENNEDLYGREYFFSKEPIDVSTLPENYEMLLNM